MKESLATMKQVYKYYFDPGNLLDTDDVGGENNVNERLTIEYLDGSKYKGNAIVNERKGILIKHGKGYFERKLKNNLSYFQSYSGMWREDVPNSQEVRNYSIKIQGELVINMNQFPKNHILKKMKAESIKYQGPFKDGELEGNVNVIVNGSIRYKSKFSAGVEYPQSI